MKGRIVLALCALALVCAPALAEDKKAEAAAAAAAAPAPDMAAMMKAMSPGEPHKHLAKLAGDWTFTNKMWMDPSQQPTTSTGTMHGEVILGGRYVHSVWKGDMMGMPFEGHGTDGYDNMTHKFVSTWVDNMGTGIMYMTGDCKDNVCTSTGDMMDPMSGQKVTTKMVSTWNADGTLKMEMYAKDASGNEMKTMEMLVAKK